MHSHTNTHTHTLAHSLEQAPCNWMHVDNDGNLCKVQATPASPATEIVARSAINRALVRFLCCSSACACACACALSGFHLGPWPVWTLNLSDAIMDIDWERLRLIFMTACNTLMRQKAAVWHKTKTEKHCEIIKLWLNKYTI